MLRDKEYRSKSKKTNKMTRNGLVERDAVTGEERHVGRRDQDFDPRDVQRAPPELAPGGSVRQTIRNSDVRSRSGHTQRTQPPVETPSDSEQPEAASPGDVCDDTYNNGRTRSLYPRNEVPVLPGTSTVSSDRHEPYRPPDHPLRRESNRRSAPNLTNRRQPGQEDYQRMFSGDAPAHDVNTPVSENPSVPDDGTPITNSPVKSNDETRTNDAPKPRDDLSTDDSEHTRSSETPAESNPLITEPARNNRPGRTRFNDSKTPVSPNKKATRRVTVTQQRATGGDTVSDKKTVTTGISVPVVPPRKESKLEFAKDEQPPDPAPRDRKLKKAGIKLDKTTAKLDQARANLPTKRKARLTREFDADTGKLKRRLTFEKEVKTQQQHIKGALPLRPVKAAANTLIQYGHKKIHQVEGDNVAVEAAHRGVIVIEGALRKGYRLHKTRPYRRVAKLQHRSVKQSIKLSYRKAIHDNPRLKSNIFSRIAQKRKIKRQYAKVFRETRKAVKRAGTAARATGRIAAFVVRHPLAFGIIALILLLAIFIASAVSSCSNMATGGFSSIFGASYLANDADIDNAELLYTGWESDLLLQIENTEIAYPYYDEYRYNVDDVGHNPHELLAYLTAVYQDFTATEAATVLAEIFAEQYTLEYVPVIETRYNASGSYDWYVLNINLTALSFSDVVAPRIDSNQRERFNLLMTNFGNRQYLVNPFSFNWMPFVTYYYGWRIHPVTGVKDYHKGIDIGVAQGTEILAGHDGVVASANDTGSFGLVVVLDNGKGLISKYAHCSELLVSEGQAVTRGDVIAKVGNTGESTEPHLHMEIIKNGQYLNPLYFAITGDDGSGGILPGLPGGPVIPEYPGEPMGDGIYATLMEEAQKHLGKAYVFGAKGPDNFDCSGFVCWSLTKSGVKSIATNAQGLFNASTPVSAEDARPGDLIFFKGTYSTVNTVTHVGIYIGYGKMIHAGDPIQYSSFETPYWQNHFYSYGRI